MPIPAKPRVMTCMMLLQALSAFFLLFSSPAPSSASAVPLTALEERGKAIFFKGVSGSGAPLAALFRKEQIKLTGQAVACATCHGYDGLGRTDSGIASPSISWRVLMKSYGHTHADGVEHAPFTEENLKGYLTDGRYPGGKRGNPDMPVYSLSGEDQEAVIAYLKRFESDLDPGLTDTKIRIGSIIPSEGSLGEMGEAMAKTIQAYFTELNAKGGLYGRTLELVVERTGGRAVTAEQLKALPGKNLFALAATFTPGMDNQVASAVEREGIPLVGPFTLFPRESISLNRHTFYLLAGLREQVRALATFAGRKMKTAIPRVALLYPAREDLGEIVDAAEEVFKAKGTGTIQRSPYPAAGFAADALVRQLKKDAVNLVLFLGDESEAGALFKAAAQEGWTPQILSPGVLLGKGVYDVPLVFRDKLYLAFPTLPDDRKEWGLAELAGLLKKHNVTVTNFAAQQTAFVAAKILEEGLRRSGKDLSRERFLSEMEKLYEFDTGLTPLISFDRNRRIGAMGAYIVTVDPARPDRKEFISSKEWVVSH